MIVGFSKASFERAVSAKDAFQELNPYYSELCKQKNKERLMDSVQMLKKLITFRTTADRITELAKALDYIESILKKKNIWIQRLILKGPNRPVMYACTKKTKTPDILLVPHVDVVEAEDIQFIPKQKGNWLYGRGSNDCKSNLVVTIQALLAFAGSDKSLGAFFTTDEEIGGPTTKYLIESGFLGKRSILLDGDRAIIYRQKGILNLKVSVKGKSSHGSMPWEGDNANEKIMTAYQKIKKLFPATTQKDRWKETVNLGIMKGGDVINKVADRSEMYLNIRLTEKADYKKILSNIKKIKEVSKVEILGHHIFISVDPKAGYIREFKKIMEKELRSELPLRSMHGATDANNFAGYKTELIITGVGAGKNMHGQQECLYLPGLLEFQQALIRYIDQAI